MLLKVLGQKKGVIVLGMVFIAIASVLLLFQVRRPHRMDDATHSAIVGSEVEKIRKLDPDQVRSRDVFENSALHIAIRSEAAAILLGLGADVNAENRISNTPLHLAAFTGNIDMVRFLVENGANVDSRNAFGQTALHLVCQVMPSDSWERSGIERHHQISGDPEDSARQAVIKLLLAKLRDPWTKDYFQNTPRDYAKEWRSNAISDALIISLEVKK